MEKLDHALAKIAGSTRPSASRIDYASSVALKLDRHVEEVVERLADFYTMENSSSGGQLTALYLIDAVLVKEKKKGKSQYIAEGFQSRLKNMLEKFKFAGEKERHQISKVLGRWKKYDVYSGDKLREFSRAANCTVGVAEKTGQQSGGSGGEDKSGRKKAVSFREDSEGKLNESDRPRSDKYRKADKDERYYDKDMKPRESSSHNHNRQQNGEGRRYEDTRDLLKTLADRNRNTGGGGAVLDLSGNRKNTANNNYNKRGGPGDEDGNHKRQRFDKGDRRPGSPRGGDEVRNPVRQQQAPPPPSAASSVPNAKGVPRGIPNPVPAPPPPMKDKPPSAAWGKFSAAKSEPEQQEQQQQSSEAAKNLLGGFGAKSGSSSWAKFKK